MSSSTRPENEQQPSTELKQEISPLPSGNAKQDPPEQADPSDSKQAPITEQPDSSKPDQHSKSTEEEFKSTEQSQETHHEPVADKGKSTITGLASSAATTATSAALGMKDNVFSMFGGGAKKEKKEIVDDPEERSGSAKAQKESKAEAQGEASLLPDTIYSYYTLTCVFALRTTPHPSPPTYILNRYIF